MTDLGIFMRKILNKPVLVPDVDQLVKDYHNFYANGEFYYEEACFSGLKYTQLKNLVMFYPWEDINKEYLNFVLNDPFFGEFAITKDVQEGMEEGFHFDVTGGLNKASVSLIAFRFFFDAKRYGDRSFNWNKFVDAGFSGHEAYWLAETHTIEGNTILYSPYNNHHCLGFYNSAEGTKKLCFSCFNRENTLKNQDQFAFKMWEIRKEFNFRGDSYSPRKISKTEMKDYLEGCK